MTSGWRRLADQWLRLAHQDLELARLARDSSSIADDAFGARVQGAIEKALKAVVATRGQLPPPTHDLPRLLQLTAIEQHPFDLDALDELAAYHGAGVQPGWPSPPRRLDRRLALSHGLEAARWAAGLVQLTD